MQQLPKGAYLSRAVIPVIFTTHKSVGIISKWQFSGIKDFIEKDTIDTIGYNFILIIS